MGFNFFSLKRTLQMRHCIAMILSAVSSIGSNIRLCKDSASVCRKSWSRLSFRGQACSNQKWISFKSSGAAMISFINRSTTSWTKSTIDSCRYMSSTIASVRHNNTAKQHTLQKLLRAEGMSKDTTTCMIKRINIALWLACVNEAVTVMASYHEIHLPRAREATTIRYAELEANEPKPSSPVNRWTTIYLLRSSKHIT